LALGQKYLQILCDLLTEDMFLLGSIVVFKRRCGKAVCHCQKKGNAHESLVVSRWVDGKLNVVYSAPAERSQLLAYREAYRTFRKGKKELMTIQKQIQEKLETFAKLKTQPYRPS